MQVCAVAERAQCATTEEKLNKIKHLQIKRTTNTHNANQYRNALQILAMLPNTETRCKCSQCNQIQKHAAKTHNTTKYRNTLK